jgi:hypothetical protein
LSHLLEVSLIFIQGGQGTKGRGEQPVALTQAILQQLQGLAGHNSSRCNHQQTRSAEQLGGTIQLQELAAGWIKLQDCKVFLTARSDSHELETKMWKSCQLSR